MEFTNFKEAKPAAGMVTWKISIQGIDVLFNAPMRMRGAGFESVLSPEFDYWDGYRVHVKHDVSWSDEPIVIKDHAVKLVGDINCCPICKKHPTIKHNRSNPMDAEYFYVECCSWIDGFSNRNPNINSLISDWNKIGEQS